MPRYSRNTAKVGVKHQSINQSNIVTTGDWLNGETKA